MESICMASSSDGPPYEPRDVSEDRQPKRCPSTARVLASDPFDPLSHAVPISRAKAQINGLFQAYFCPSGYTGIRK